jgi:hypothetical protein
MRKRRRAASVHVGCAMAAIDTLLVRPDHPCRWPARRETCVTTKFLGACAVLLLAACSEVQSQHRTSGGIRSLADMGVSPAEPSCLGSFAGPVTLLDQDYGYSTTKIATWPDQARFDARGGRWTSLMNGYDADGNRANTAPVQLGLDWGTNVDGRGRRDLWSAEYDTPPQEVPVCFSGGIILGTQPVDATWGETKRDGGGYAISINGKGAVVEAVRIHNHHDGFVPYRSDGFVLRDSWLSYIRDDCIENDGHAEGTVRGNLFDGCYVFYSGTNGIPNAPTGAGADGTLLIEGNLIRMQNMPGPYARRNPLGDRSASGYGEVFKTRGRDGRVPKLVMRNNVLAFEKPAEGRKLQTRFNGPHVEIVDCANNTILWLGSGSFPGSLPDDWEECFTIIGGSEAQERWDRLRMQWIDAHPDIPRL